jgi:hypothetical protein
MASCINLRKNKRYNTKLIQVVVDIEITKNTYVCTEAT